MKVVGRHLVARCLAQPLQYPFSLHDFTDGERREPVEVDNAALRLCRPHVALRPLAYVAIESHGGNVSPRRKIHDVTIGDEVRERQAARVGVIHEFAETHRECSDVCRHQHISATGRLGTPLQCAIVHGAHLIGMVGEVGGRTGVVERELATDE